MPKTEKSRRSMALSPLAVLRLRAHRETHEALHASVVGHLPAGGLVFAQPDGGPFLPDSVSHAFAKIARRAGLESVRLHDLRQAHATLLLQQGAHPKIVQERLGHPAIAVTLDIYSHVTPGLQEEAALKFDEQMAGLEVVPWGGGFANG